MEWCWEFEPEDRPTFVQIAKSLSVKTDDEFKKHSFICNEYMKLPEAALLGDDPLNLEDKTNVARCMLLNQSITFNSFLQYQQRKLRI